MIHSAPSRPGMIGSILSRWIDITWFCGLGRDTGNDEGAMGSVGRLSKSRRVGWGVRWGWKGRRGQLSLRLSGSDGRISFFVFRGGPFH